MAQDDYYYEIQLTNKQLVFYFMAGATGLILSFLAGVMVGRGVDTAQGEVQARNLAEERVIAEEPAVRATPSPELTYAQRLEADRVDTSLERPAAPKPVEKRSAGPATPAPTRVAAATPPPTTVRPAPKRPAAPAATAATPKPTPKPAPATGTAGPGPAAPKAAAPAPAGAGQSFSIQVGAFKDKATADSIVARLKTKGFAAYVVSPESNDPGLYVVRVGHYAARADAERAEARLRDQEKFSPFIVKQ